MTVGELTQRMDSRELSEWRAYYNIDSWERRRQDFHLAQIAAVMLNAWRGKNDPAAKIADLMPYVQPDPPPEQSIEEQKLALRTMVR